MNTDKTPLPTDEEIEQAADFYTNNIGRFVMSNDIAFAEGAKWLLSRLQPSSPQTGRQAVVIESVGDHIIEWGLSFSDHNPEAKDYFRMHDKETAFRLKEYLHQTPTDRTYSEEELIHFYNWFSEQEPRWDTESETFGIYENNSGPETFYTEKQIIEQFLKYLNTLK